MESDQQLIDAINKGDAAAFETLYYRYRDWIYNLAWRNTCNHHDAIDILQDTYIYLLEKFPGFRLSSSMTTFLYPVVKHLSLNTINRNKLFTSQRDNHTEITACDTPVMENSRPELEAVLANLPIEQREVLLMRFVDDMTIDEIAGALKEPAGTIKSRLYRALELVREDSRTRNYFLE
jgi:RNA polymerase sigma-70 factor, ECF subfamily